MAKKEVGRIFTIQLYPRKDKQHYEVKVRVTFDEIDELVGIIDRIESLVGTGTSECIAFADEDGRFVVNIKNIEAILWNDEAWEVE